RLLNPRGYHMSSRCCVILTFCGAILTQTADAAPIFTVSPGPIEAGNRQWSVYVAPDASLFYVSGPIDTPPNTLGGIVAIEVGFSVTKGNLVNVIRNTIDFPNDIPGTQIPGFPPSLGLTVSGNKIAAHIGSDFLTSATPYKLLTITTLGSGPTTLSWLG